MRKLQNRRSAVDTSAFGVERLEDRRLLSGSASFDPGSVHAIAAAADGTLYVAYFRPTGATSGDLRYAIRNADGTWRATGADGGIIDNSSAFVGASVTMALDSTGKPGVAYTDSTNADLRYAHFNGTNWDSGLVGTTTGKRGNYPSLAYLSNKPTISHFVKTSTGGYLSVDQNTSLAPTNPATWSTTQIDTSGEAGRYSEIKYNAGAGKWAIAYTDSDVITRGPRYVETSGSSVTSGWGLPVAVPQPLGALPSQAWWSSMVFDSSNRPAFAWYNDASCDAIFSHRNGALNTWNSVRVDISGITGRNTSLVIDGGQFNMAYYDQGHGTIEVRSGGDTNVAWTTEPNIGGGVVTEFERVISGGANVFGFSDGDRLFVTDDQAGTSWTKQSGSSAFGGRYRHASAVFDDNSLSYPGAEMWVIGGYRGNAVHNDVWASNDGLNWRTVHADNDVVHTAFTPRQATASVAFDNNDVSNPGEKMWVLGGQAGTSEAADKGDVWWTQNGQDWTKVTTGGVDVDFGARRDHAAVVFNGQMFVIGGVGPSGAPTNRIVSSSDGVTWSAVSGGQTAGDRWGGVALVYNGSIYVMGASGGGNYSTYKSDSTGTSWTLVAAQADVNLNVGGGAGSVYDGKMWVVNGSHTYWSTDGATWTQVADDTDGGTPMDYRQGMTALTFAKTGEGNRLWLLGGYINLGQSYKDDAWSTT